MTAVKKIRIINGSGANMPKKTVTKTCDELAIIKIAACNHVARRSLSRKNAAKQIMKTAGC